jgi:hypothetical protein
MIMHRHLFVVIGCWLWLGWISIASSSLIWYVGLEGQYHHYYAKLLASLYPHSHQWTDHSPPTSHHAYISTRSFPAGGSPTTTQRFDAASSRQLFASRHHKYDLLHAHDRFQGQVKFIVGNRRLLDTAWSYGRPSKRFDLSFENHARVCLAFWQGITDQLLQLPCSVVHQMPAGPITAPALRQLYHFLQLEVSPPQLQHHLNLWQPWHRHNHSQPAPAQVQWFAAQQREYNFSAWNQWQPC